jgi:hypothetical protein
MIIPDHLPMGVILFLFFVLAFHACQTYGVWGFLASGAALWLLMLNFPNG